MAGSQNAIAIWESTYLTIMYALLPLIYSQSRNRDLEVNALHMFEGILAGLTVVDHSAPSWAKGAIEAGLV